MNVAEFLGLTLSAGRWTLPVTQDICGGRSSIFGGCGLAAAIEVAEQETGRPAVWAACQFLRPAFEGQTVEFKFEASATGRAVSHTRVIGYAEGKELFVTLISLGTRSFPGEGVWAKKPEVPGPDSLPERYIRAGHKGGFRKRIQQRAVTKDPTGIMKAVEGKSTIWIQLPGGIPATASALALIGDEMSTGTAAIFDPDTQAPSIDNTLRVVTPVACEWVLADIEVRAAANGFAHGIVNLWSPDGTLLGIATQTGALRTRGT